jgi:hypothetical protein
MNSEQIIASKVCFKVHELINQDCNSCQITISCGIADKYHFCLTESDLKWAEYHLRAFHELNFDINDPHYACMLEHYERQLEKAKNPIDYELRAREVLAKREELLRRGYCAECRTIHNPDHFCSWYKSDLIHRALEEVLGDIDDEDFISIYSLVINFDKYGNFDESSRF